MDEMESVNEIIWGEMVEEYEKELELGVAHLSMMLDVFYEFWLWNIIYVCDLDGRVEYGY